MTSRMLGIGFLSPAIIAASIFFLLPVLLTVVFAFTNMSTSTGIMGGDYQINTEQLRSVAETGISAETVEKLETAGYQISEAGLAALAEQFGESTAEDLREDFIGESFCGAPGSGERLCASLTIQSGKHEIEKPLPIFLRSRLSVSALIPKINSERPLAKPGSTRRTMTH